jgi:cell division septal protein FtsQ
MKRNRTLREARKYRSVGLISFALLILIGVFGLFADQWRKEKRFIRMMVQGAAITSPDEIRRLAALPDSASLADLDLAAIAARIRRHPFVRSVELTRNPPDELDASIVERTPIAVVITEGGADLYVDRDGVILPHRANAAVYDLPIITGLEPEIRLEAGKKVLLPRFQQALEVLFAAESMGGDVYHLISEVSIAHRQDMVLYTIENAVPVIFGPAMGAERKLRSFEAFWKEIAMKNGSTHLEYIDVRFAERIVVKWKDAFIAPQPVVRDSVITEL